MLRTKLPFFLAYARARQQPIFVEYIESTGTQWLDTGLYLDSYRIVIEAQGTETPPNNYSILCSHLRDYAGNALFAYYTGVWGLQSSALTTASLFERTKLDATFDMVGGFPHTVLTINGKTTEYQRTNIPSHTRHNIEIFNAQASTHVNKEFVGRVYGFQIYSPDGNLLMDAKPCLHPKTLVACMYDTVSRKYLYNQGTGEFIASPIFVEYIQSTGTQYINTGIGHEQGRYGKWVVIAKSTNTNKLKMLLGNGGTGIQFFACNSKGKWGFGENIYFDINADTKITADIVFEDTQVTATIDDESIVRTGTISTRGDFILGNFALVQNQYNFNGYIYGCSYTDADGNLALDLRPCIDPKTSEVCMYDMVSKQYLYNQGTGNLVGYKQMDIDYTRIYAYFYYVDGVNKWSYAPDSYSIVIPVEVGKKYQLVWETTEGIGTIFRYGQTDIPKAEGQVLKNAVRTSPQTTPIADITAVDKYLVVQISNATANVVVENKYLKCYEVIG